MYCHVFFSPTNPPPEITGDQMDVMCSSLKSISEKYKFDKELVFNSEKFAEALTEKSAESAEYDIMDLSYRQKQILNFMQLGIEYSTEEIAGEIGLKGPRTRQLLNELAAMVFVRYTAATKNRRYVKNFSTNKSNAVSDFMSAYEKLDDQIPEKLKDE